MPSLTLLGQIDTTPPPAPVYALERLRDALGELLVAQGTSGAARAWENYLVAHNRVLNKCEGHFRTSKAWAPLLSKYSTKRKTDTTLIYLHHARHADEHGLEPVTSERIKSWAVGGSGLVRELVIGNGQVKKFDASPGIELKVAVGLVPAAVVNRGVKYEPPIGATLASLAQDGQPV